MKRMKEVIFRGKESCFDFYYPFLPFIVKQLRKILKDNKKIIQIFDI